MSCDAAGSWVWKVRAGRRLRLICSGHVPSGKPWETMGKAWEKHGKTVGKW